MRVVVGTSLVAVLSLAAACAVGADKLPAKAAPPAKAADVRLTGQQLYARHCLSCHQADGGGVPDMQPAIKGGVWVKGDGKVLAAFVMTGGFGSAERKDSANDNVMPEFRQLSNEDLAAILTFIRQKFGDGAPAVAVADVAEARTTLPDGAGS